MRKSSLLIIDDKITRKIIAKTVEELGLAALQLANGKQDCERLCENDAMVYVC